MKRISIQLNDVSANRLDQIVDQITSDEENRTPMILRSDAISHALEISEMGSTVLASKDAEITTLRSQVEDLNKNYTEVSKIIKTTQEAISQHESMKNQIARLKEEKDMLEEKLDSYSHRYQTLQQYSDSLSSTLMYTLMKLEEKL